MTEALSFSVHLRYYRTQKELSLGELSRRTGLVKATLSNWEAGRTRPGTPELEQLFAALEMEERDRQTFRRLLALPRALVVLPVNERPSLTGSLLRAMRLRRGLSQSVVARRLGIRQGTLAKWEKSEDWPTVERLSVLCSFLGASPPEVEAILGGVFFATPLSYETSDDFLESYVHQFFQRATTLPSDPLLDLDVLSLDSLLWSRADAFAQEQRRRLWRICALYLELQERYEEAMVYTSRVLAAPSHLRAKNAYSNQSTVILHAKALLGRSRQRNCSGAVVRPARQYLQNNASLITDCESLAWYWMYLGELLIKEGKPDAAWDCIKRSNSIPHPHCERLQTHEACLITANHLVDLGCANEALELLETKPMASFESSLGKARHSHAKTKALIRLHKYSEASSLLNQTYHWIDGGGMDFMRSRTDTLALQLLSAIREI